MNIEEMAIKHAKDCYTDKASAAAVAACVFDFKLGANAVLEEIEAVLNKGNESRCDDFFTIAEITRKIEQLKK